MIESGLLERTSNRTATLEGEFYTFEHLDGLTPTGDEYVKNVSKSNIWKMTEDEIIEADLQYTTMNVMKVLPDIFDQLLK